MNHKLIIISIITAIIYLLIFSYILIFEYNSFDIPNHSFLRIKELKKPGAIDEYIDWSAKREKPEGESDKLYLLGALMPISVLILLSEDLLIRTNKVYSALINKKLNIASLINVVLISILYFVVLYFNDYFRLYITMIPSLALPIDILILCIFLVRKLENKL